MAPFRQFRCLTITLVIGLAAIESQGRAFTVQRHPDLEPTPSMTTTNETTVPGSTSSSITTLIMDGPSTSPIVATTTNEMISNPITTTLTSTTSNTAAVITSVSGNIEKTNKETDRNNGTRISDETEERFLTIAPLLKVSTIINEKPNVTTTEANKDVMGYYTMIPNDIESGKEMITNNEFLLTDAMYELLPEWQKEYHTTGEVIKETPSTSKPNVSSVRNETNKLTSENLIDETTSVQSKSRNTFKMISFYRQNKSDTNNIKEQSVTTQRTDDKITESTTLSINIDGENLSWKKYKLIDRKHIPLDEEHRWDENDKARSDILASNNSKEPVGSQQLEKEEDQALSLKDDITPLPITTEYKTIERQPHEEITELVEYTTENEILKKREEITNSINIRSVPYNPNVMSSRRAGFLNSNATPNSQTKTDEIFTTETFTSDKNEEEPTTKGDIFTTYPNERNNTSADYGIKIPTHTESVEGFSTTVTPAKSTHDNLSVKPISDKSKTTIYTVSPNYKPLKKIEVSPPKHVVRDPDDNSWRNESLSSLGIVFKAKNSSKSFTEVLKNKTETEFNALSEKNSKEEPELRTRLEKIAEQRKSKKKKPDGTDCDPKNNDCKELQSAEADSKTSSPNNSFGAKPAPDYYEDVDDDADYVTLANIDLKKYMSSVTEKPKKSNDDYRKSLHRNSAVSDFKSINLNRLERKPTVQYFPPRIEPQVNFNEYDEKFMSKMNLFTSTTTPATTDIFVVTYPTLEDYANELDRNRHTTIPQLLTSPPSLPQFKLDSMKIFVTNAPHHTIRSHEYTVANKEDSYVKADKIIKHLKELLHFATKSDIDAHDAITEPVTKTEDNPETKLGLGEYDEYMGFPYKSEDKFMNTFHPDNARIHVNFPLIYNMSVIHSKGGKGHASSNAYFRRHYDKERRKGYHTMTQPHVLDLFRVEESAAHSPPPEYDPSYVEPDLEQTEEVEAKSDMLPPYLFRFRK